MMAETEKRGESGGKREAQWRCPKCLAAHRTEVAAPGAGPWACESCGEAQPARADALAPDGALIACPICGCPDLYRQRDFNRKLGIAIILVGAALAPFTYFLSLVACALIDFAIYRFLPEIVCCYHCKAVLRGYPGASATPIFDLNTSDKYLSIERKRGW